MRENKLNIGIIIRILFSLLPILFGMPTVAAIFCAYNIAMTFVVFGPMATIVSSLTAVAAAMFFSSSFGAEGELAGLALGLQAALCATGCILGLFIKKDFYQGLTLSTAGFLAPQLVYANSIAHANGMSLADMLVPKAEEMETMINQMLLSFPEGMMTLGEETIGAISELTRNITVMLIPSALIISSMVIAYIVMWSVAAPLRHMPDHQKVHSFSHIKLPRICSFIILVLIPVSIYGLTGGNKLVSAVALNMLFILLSMAFFAGISLFDFYLRKAIPIKFLRFVIHAIIAFNFFPVYVFAAFIDSFINFRKLQKSTTKKGGGDFETKK